MKTPSKTLPPVTNNYDRSDIAESFLNEEGISLEDLALETESPLATYNYYRSDIVESWLSEEGRSLEDLKAVFTIVTDNYDRSDIAESWLGEEGRSLEDLEAVLPLFTDERSRSNIASSWLSKEGRSLEDLETVLPLFTDERSRSNIASSWLSEERRSLEDFQAVLPLFTKQSSQFQIARSWLSKEGRSSEDFQTVLPFFTDERSRSDIAESWLSEEGRSSEDLKTVLPLVTSNYYRSKIAQSWFSEEVRSLEDLKTVLPFVTEQSSQFRIASSWLSKEGRSSEDLKTVLPFVTEQSSQSQIASSWLSKEGRSLEDLKTVLPLVTSNYYRSKIAQSWFSEEVRSLEDLKTVLPFVTEQSSQFQIASSWLSKEGRSSEDFKTVLPFVTEQSSQSQIASSWLSKEGRSLEDLKTVLPFVTEQSSQFRIASSWLSKEGRSSEDLKAVLPLFTEQSSQFQIASSWLSKEGRSSEDLKTVLPLVTDEWHRSDIAESWLSKEGRSSEDLKTVLPLVTDEPSRSIIAESWLSKEGRSLEDFQAVLPFVTDERSRFVIALSYLNNTSNPQTKYENFTELAKAGIFPSSDKYDIVKIAQTYLGLSLPTDKFPSLGVDLYPNSELMQIELFKNFLSRVDANSLNNIKPQLKAFIQNLHEDEAAFEVITEVRSNITLPPSEILEITKNRLSNKYESVSDLLNGKSLEESLIEQGLQNVRELFSNYTSPIDINLADLFSYYDVQNDLVSFKSFIAPEVLQEIAAVFSPSSKKAYISNVEFGKMSNLFNSEETPESNLTLPSVKIIADFLGSKVGNINQVLTPAEITDYQFGNSTTLQNEEIPNRREYLTEKFKSLLTEINPSVEKVSEFFERALNPELANPQTTITAENRIINHENQGKLTSFFNSNKNLLASLFQKEEGLDNFAGTISSLGDGCVANIATQAKIALYQSLITNPYDQILFGTFKEKISGAILNSVGDLLTSSAEGINVFNNNDINKNFISPNGLLKALAEEFYANGKIKRNAVEFIEKEFGKDGRDNLVESILENDPDSFDQEMARISAYVILQKTLPDLCENKYLTKPKGGYLEILQKAVNLNPSTSIIAEDFSQVVEGQRDHVTG